MITFTITYAWWWIPVFTTAVCLVFIGLTDCLFCTLSALLVIATSWAVAGILK